MSDDDKATANAYGRTLMAAVYDFLMLHQPTCSDCQRAQSGTCRVEQAVARLYDFEDKITGKRKKKAPPDGARGSE